MIRGWRLVVGAIPLAAFLACSGSDKPSTFEGGDQKESPDPSYDAGNFFKDAGPDVDERKEYCSPDVASTFGPTWRAPAAFGQKACTALEIDQYYQACLANLADTAACTKYAQEHAGCAKCIESKDTDTTQGPVVFHLNRTYYTVNLAGCIARTLGDVSASGCGALYGGAQECRRVACEGCFEIKEPSFQKFTECQSAASKEVCKPYTAQWNQKCPVLRNDEGTGAAQQCFPKESTAKGAFLAIAPLFCGG
jgi:hypothetical protein